MSVYTPPALNAVDYALEAFTPADLTPAGIALSSYTAPALNAVDFALVAHTPPTIPYVGWELLPDPGSGITGTIAISQASDTWALTGNVLVSGTIAWTQAADTWAITAAARVSGTAAWTQASDTWALTGAAAVSGTLGISQASDTWSLTGAAVVEGVASLTQQNDTWLLEGTVVAAQVQQSSYDGGSYARQRGYGRFGRKPVRMLRHAEPAEEQVFAGKSRTQVLELQLLLLG